jgi:hypothetical protein
MAYTIPKSRRRAPAQQPSKPSFRQQTIDAAKAEAAPPAPPNLGALIPPIQQSDLIPPVTPGNTLGGLTPPITPGNTAPDLGSQIPPIMPGNSGGLGALIPPITPATTVDPGQTGSIDPQRAALAQIMAGQSPRAQEANYTTSGRGWPGSSSAIFGKRRK